MTGREKLIKIVEDDVGALVDQDASDLKLVVVCLEDIFEKLERLVDHTHTLS